MTAACVYAGAKLLASVSAAFSLSWTHSVEKTGWQEDWQVTDAGLVLTEARVKGSGAGMDPGEGAVLENGWWRWTPRMAPVPELALAASGATVSGWRLCHGGKPECLELGDVASDNGISIRPCETASK